MTAYELATVEQRALWDETRVVVDGTTFNELLAEIRRLEAEKDVLRVSLTGARERYAAEHDRRLLVHERLDKAARVFSVLSFVFPQVREVVARARKDIWP